MKRKYTYIEENKLTEEVTIIRQFQIIFNPKKKIKMDLIDYSSTEFKKMSPAKKGELLEVKTKAELERYGFTVTITKAQRWDDQNKQVEILGDNGIDGIVRKKIEKDQYNGIIQCKCYAPTSNISTDVIAQLDNNIDHWKTEKSFGLLVVLTKDSINNRANNAILNARNPIIAITLQEIKEGLLEQRILEIKWEKYPGKQLKRTRIQLEEAEEIENIGELKIVGKKLKNLIYEEDIVQY
jgi:hypothetical protein